MGKPNPSDLKKGPWTREEDQKLLAYIEENGHGSWRSLPAKAGLQRCGKSCRLRWTNYLRPDIKRGKFSTHEEKTIIRLHALLGNRWSAIAAHLPKRTDNEIKNYWNTRLKKRLTRMGIDPVTHRPKSIAGGGSAQMKHAANLTHMAQWETARLEAEARLARESKLHSNIQLLQKLSIPPPLQMAAAHPQCLDVLKVWQATSGGGSSCFLGSPTTLESPTSTLNFPCSSIPTAVPTIRSIMANDVVASGACGGLGHTAKGNMDHDHQLAAYPLDYGYQMAAAMELAAGVNHGSDGYDMTAASSSSSFGEIEDTRNYWNELLNMVTSPMELPGF